MVKRVNIREEYLEGVLVSNGGKEYLTLTFSAHPPGAWTDRYNCEIAEQVDEHGTFYVLRGSPPIDEFIEEEMPEFVDFVKLVRERGGILRLPKVLLEESPKERKKRLKELKEEW